MSITLIRSVASAVLLAALAAGCGTAVAAHSAAPKPAATQPSHPAPTQTTPSAQPSQPAPMHTAVTTPPGRPTTAPASPANPIPQGNGGDHDSDNNGGPSDGDGTL